MKLFTHKQFKIGVCAKPIGHYKYRGILKEHDKMDHQAGVRMKPGKGVFGWDSGPLGPLS